MVLNDLRQFFISIGITFAATTAFADVGHVWTIGNLTNNEGATITSSDNVAILGTGSAGPLGTLSNAGDITSTHGGGSAAIWIQPGLNVSGINNSSTGLISSASYDAVVNQNSVIESINNAGTIRATSGGMFGIANGASGVITTITNTGTIFGIHGGIYNDHFIATLNNAQGAGNAVGGLTHYGNLPNNYNIIVNSPANYGQLSVSSPGSSITNFGVHNSSKLQTGTYGAVLSGVGSNNLGVTNGKYGIYKWYLSLNSTDIWDLIVESSISASNTLITAQQNAAALAATYNVQAAALQAGLSYDCNTFDQHGLCASIGGRTTYGLTAPSGNQQAGLLIISHRLDSHLRYGGFVDQSVATASPSGIKYNNSGPMFGFFGYWNHQKDGMGLGASLSAAFSNSNMTVTRNSSLAMTEAGKGNTEMQGQAIQAQSTYALQANSRIKAIPYLGLRYYRIGTGGYSENPSSDVTSPLTYNAMAQEVFAAVSGIGTSVFLAQKLTGTASVGIQQNLNYKMSNYKGTSTIAGLETFSISMPANTNSMATATAGITYAVKKNEKIGINVLWQQQAFTATNTLTGLATYTFGF
ncbi:MAG: autotransporter domain-containing protein [Fluviibacter phosphoraccumulans]